MNELKIPEAFMGLLRSRRFVAAAVSMLVMLLVVAIPQLEPLQDRLVNIVVSIILALLGAPALV
jgi:hypothetical protein